MRIQAVIPRKESPKGDRVSFHALRVGFRILFHSQRGRRARRAILFTLLALLCVRIGYFIALPGIDWMLADLR